MEAHEETARRETCDAWYARYDAHRRQLGRQATIGLFRKWVSPWIGAMRIADVRVEDVERIRDALDQAVDAWWRAGGERGRGRLSGRTAMSVWWCLCGAFRAARTHKRRELRVLAGGPNPCADVEPPGDPTTRRDRRKTFIYPEECARLLRCVDVSRKWRELHAIAAYTYLRPGELHELRWHDVDLEHGRIHVARSSSFSDGLVKLPKTVNGVRDVPIEPALHPLLRRMRQGRRASELVVPVMHSRSTDTLAWRTRAHLIAAGATRTALHETTLATARASFRSWRDSGLTWLAMRGLDIARIMRRAGHADIGTTIGYVKLAEDLDGRLGVPFGPLPHGLVRGR
jgi:integrase